MGVSVTLYVPLDVGQPKDKDVPYWENDYHEFYSGNTTHNLITMAGEANLYEAIWRPYRLFNVSEDEEYDIEIHAEDISSQLKLGLDKLRAKPEFYKTFDSPNGWGLYIHFVEFVQRYYDACINYPKAIVDVSR